jgi:tetratricopeptide (TPR) repeat protein
MKIEELVVLLSKDPFNPQLNFDCAVEYERLNQTASAVSFYLRTAEYGNGVLVYNSLLKVARCFEDQNDRINTVSNCILQALAYDPSYPDAWFVLAQFHERQGNWQECYTFAEIGLDKVGRWELPANVGYLGAYCLEFEKAVSAWWIGRKEESQVLLTKLSTEDMSEEYKVAVKSNMERVGLATI